MLRPVLFNIYICDIFFFIEKSTVNSYADDTTHFSNGTKAVLNDMESKRSNIFDWFSKNYLKVNPDKSNLLFTSIEKNFYKNWRLYLKSSTSKKLLGANIDVNSSLLSMFQNYLKKQAKNSMLLHKFPVASTQIRLMLSSYRNLDITFLLESFTIDL